MSLAAGVTLYEFFAKYLLYYLHERAWLLVPPLAIRRLYGGRSKGRESHGRSLLKGLSWRLVASGTTLVISWMVTGNASLAGAIAGMEFFAKIVVYYLHERFWLCLPRRRDPTSSD